MSGWYVMHRGWMDSPIFKNEPFTEREAWEWLISEAAFAGHKANIKNEPVWIDRGQLSHSIRFLADKWGWKRTKTSDFLEKLKKWDMIRTENRTGQTVITICNYSKYQDDKKENRTESGHKTGQSPDRERTKNNNGNNGNNNNKVGYQDSNENTGAEKTPPTNQPNFILLNDFAEAIPQSWADWVRGQADMSDGDIIAEAKKLADKSRAKGADKITFRQWKGWITAEIKFRQESRTAASGSENNLPVKKPERDLEPWEQRIAEHMGKTAFLAWCDGAKLDGSTLIVDKVFTKSHLDQHFGQKLKRAGVTEIQHRGGKA